MCRQKNRQSDVRRKYFLQSDQSVYYQSFRQPSQDPYAKVKFMEDIFGPELSNQFLTDVSMQTPKTNDIEALLRVLRG